MHLNLTKMKALATDIAKNTQIGDAILLNGCLGSGKTTFAKFLINHFLPYEEVTSPTFNIVNVYKIKNPFTTNIWHFDLYRIKDISELYEIGMEEALSSGISIIEWAEKIKEIKNKRIITINIKPSTKKNERIVTYNLENALKDNKQ